MIGITLIFLWCLASLIIIDNNPKLGASVFFIELTTVILLICVLVVVAELFPALRQTRVTCAECGRRVQGNHWQEGTRQDVTSAEEGPTLQPASLLDSATV